MHTPSGFVYLIRSEIKRIPRWTIVLKVKSREVIYVTVVKSKLTAKNLRRERVYGNASTYMTRAAPF